MKNRKTVIVVFLLVACLILSVGYAAFTDTLTIIGNAVIDINQAESNFDGKVKFTASQVVDSTGTGNKSADVASHTDDDATFTAHSLATLGEYAVFKFTILNDSNVPVEISIKSNKLSGDPNPTNSNPTAFKVDYEYSIDSKIIPAGETIDVTVTVKVQKAITVATSASFGIELTATTTD